MNVRLRMYQVLLFKFGRHLCKGSIAYAGGDLLIRPSRVHSLLRKYDNPSVREIFYNHDVINRPYIRT